MFDDFGGCILYWFVSFDFCSGLYWFVRLWFGFCSFDVFGIRFGL